MLDEEGLPNKAVPLFCMEIPYCHTVICHLCPRGFAIPEAVIADFKSARVTDPLFSSPVDSEIHRDEKISLFPSSFQCPRGFAIPEAVIADFNPRGSQTRC